MSTNSFLIPLQKMILVNAVSDFFFVIEKVRSLTLKRNLQDGTLCLVEELIRSYGRSVRTLLVSQLEIYGSVSDVEWELIKLTTDEIIIQIVAQVKEVLKEEGKCGNCSSWAMKAVEIMGRQQVNVLDVGTWNPTFGLDLQDDLFPHVSGGLRGRRVALSAVNDPPYLTLKKVGDTLMGSGVMAEYMDLLGSKLNFTYTLIQASGNSESGIIRQLVRNEVFMAANPVLMADKNLKQVDFAGTVEYQRYKIMYKMPGEEPKIYLFYKPFTPLVWICIAIATVLAGPVLWVIQRTSYFYKFQEEGYGGLGKLRHCVWYTFGALLQQGGNMLPKSDSARLFVGFWWIFVVVVVTTYSGNLVAFLTFPQVEPTLEGVNMMLRLGREGGMTWSIPKDSMIETYLEVYYCIHARF